MKYSFCDQDLRELLPEFCARPAAKCSAYAATSLTWPEQVT
jgi:hypothetical protein